MKITIGEMNEKIAFINKIGDSQNDKVSYTIKKLDTKIKQASKKFEIKLQEDRDDLKVDCAATDEAGLLIVKEGNYQFSKEGRLKLNKGIRRLDEAFNNNEIEFEPIYFLEGTPGFERLSEVDDEIREELTGILFEPKLKVVNDNQDEVAKATLVIESQESNI